MKSSHESTHLDRFIADAAAASDLSEDTLRAAWAAFSAGVSKKLSSRQPVAIPGFVTLTPVQNERDWGVRVAQAAGLKRAVNGERRAPRKIRLKSANALPAGGLGPTQKGRDTRLPPPGCITGARGLGV